MGQVVDKVVTSLVVVLLCLVNLLCGVWVYSPYHYSAPSVSEFSRVLGPDRMCCAKVIDASITWGRHDS